MIFKTLNGDLTVFNKTLISTKDHLKSLQTINATVYNKNGAFNLQGLLVNSSQSVSTFTKLNNAFKAYNGNLSKSTQLQNAYVQAVGKQNVTLGNYLAGLNGAKASMGGYVKSLVAAKAASIGLQAASIALNTAISMGITLAISALISQISKWVHAQEEARQKAIELTNSYKKQKDSLDSQIEKYKELKETLDNGNLSTDETRSIKEQLLEIQKSLIESYGDEASNIDLVNGKYREQLGLLSELSKGKATDYVTENRDVFADAKEALEKIRTYNVGTVTSWNTYAPETEDQKKLIEYLETYSDLLDLTYSRASHGGVSATSVNLFVKANVANADELMHQLAEDLEKYGKDNNIDVSGLLEGISGQLKKTWTDELTDYKTVYDEFMKAEVVRNDTLRPLYQQSIQAVEDYNNALSSGEGIDKAKANLDSVQQSVQNATSELEGSQEVFDGIYDGIYDGINKYAEAAYQMSQAFENDEAVKGYAEQLKGLTDIDLKAINFEDNVQSPGEEAFKALIDILGLSEDEVQNLIDKLVELGYVQGEVQDSTSNIENPISLSLTETTDQLNTQLKPTFDSLKSAYENIFTTDDNGKPLFTLENVDLSMLDSIKSAIDELNENEELGISIDYTSFENLARTLADTASTESDVRNGFNEFITDVVYGTAALENLNASDAKLIETMLESLGVTNAHEIVYDSLIAKTEAFALQEQLLASVGGDLANATSDKVLAFLNQAGASEVARNYLIKLIAEEQVFSNQDLDVSGKIAKLQELAQAYGQTALAAKIASQEKANEQSHTVGSWSEADLQQFQKEWNDGLSSVSIDFSPKSSSKSKKSGSSKKEEDKWLEEYKKKLAELQNLLAKGRLMPSLVVIQDV